MASRVRGHTRKTASGGTTKVRQHSRTGRPRKALVSPRHAWGLVKRALRANKRKKRALAVTLTVLALTEIALWVTLQGTGLILGTAGVLAVAVAVVLGAAGGARL